MPRYRARLGFSSHWGTFKAGQEVELAKLPHQLTTLMDKVQAEPEPQSEAPKPESEPKPEPKARPDYEDKMRRPKKAARRRVSRSKR